MIIRQNIKVGEMVRNKISGKLGLVKSIHPGRESLFVMNNHWMPTTWEINNVEHVKK